MTKKTVSSRPADPSADRPTKSRFARFIDTAYSMDTWFRHGGLAFILLIILTQDELRHALMRSLFNR